MLFLKHYCASTNANCLYRIILWDSRHQSNWFMSKVSAVRDIKSVSDILALALTWFPP